MSAVTYTDTTYARAPNARAPKAAPAAAAKSAAPKQGFLARLMDAIIAARTEQAERELSRYVQIHGRDPIA